MARAGCHLWRCGPNRRAGDRTIDHTIHLPIGGCPVLPNAMPRIRQYNRCGMRHRRSTRHSHGHEGQSESHEYGGNEPQQRQAAFPLTEVGLACLYFGPPCPHVALIPLSRTNLSHLTLC